MYTSLDTPSGTVSSTARLSPKWTSITTPTLCHCEHGFVDESSPHAELSALPPTLLVDGVCNLCNAAVRFVMGNDSTGRIMFASLQSDVGRTLVGRTEGLAADDPGTVVFVAAGRRYQRHTAAVQ